MDPMEENDASGVAMGGTYSRHAAIMLDITIGAKAAAEFGEDLADIVRETPIDDCCVLGRLHVGVRSIQKGTGKSILDCIPSFPVSPL